MKGFGRPALTLVRSRHAGEGVLGGPREAGEAWLGDRAPRIGAAIAFFTALSLAPILVIALAIAGLVYAKGEARGGLSDQLAGLVGEEAAETIEAALAVQRGSRGRIYAAASCVTWRPVRSAAGGTG